jgi:hypothetical protein
MLQKCISLKNFVYINVGIWHFKKRLEGRKMQKHQDHWHKQNKSHIDQGAVTLTVNSTLLDESVS